MKVLDRYLQTVRIQKAKKFIRRDDIILDIGSVDGVMFKKCEKLIGYGYGIDPVLKKGVKTAFYTLIPGKFPEAVPREVLFNTVTLLAVLEHIPRDSQKTLASNIYDFLAPQGRVIITVPSPLVDFILKVLFKLHLIDGMSLEEHYGFNPNETKRIFSKGYKLLKHQKFQFGLNNLFVFEKNE